MVSIDSLQSGMNLVTEGAVPPQGVWAPASTAGSAIPAT